MASGKIIDGKAFAASLRKNVSAEIAHLKKDHGLNPGLAVALVGDDPASAVYVRNKGEQTREAGMQSFEYRLPADTTEANVLSLVESLNLDNSVNGILVQLPLPKQIDEQKVLAAINPDKDVDGFHAINTGRLWSNIDSLVPCTPLGCKMLLLNELKDLTGKKAIIVGRSNIVGKPMASLLIGENCTVTIAHSRTKNLEEEVKKSDIIVAAVGVPEMVKGSWIKPGATIIDVGINRIEKDGKNKLVGDVEFQEAKKIAGAITPVPGGVGPMTIACLLHNTLIATCRKNGLEIPKFV